MNENPYASNSPDESSQTVVSPTGSPGDAAGAAFSFWILSSIFLVTLVFAAVNAIEESPQLNFVLLATVGAVASQIPGLILGWYRCRSSFWYARLMLIPAYCVAITGVLVYAIYAFNGRADSLNSAAHMHVIFFPVMHCILAAVGYLVFAVTLGLIFLVRRRRVD